MSYKMSAKNRKLKRALETIISVLKFESLNITTPHKVVLIGACFSIASLFMNWFDSYDSKIIGNGFDSLLGITGYILFFLNLKIIFFVLSTKQKEFVKNLFNFNIKDGFLLVLLTGFGLVVSVNTIFLIQNFSFFVEGIIIGKGIIFSIIGYIFGLIGGFFIINSKTKTSIYIDGNEENIQNDEIRVQEDKNNMKLPF